MPCRSISLSTTNAPRRSWRQHGLGDVRAAEAQLIAGGEHRFVRRRQQALAQHLGLVGARETRLGRRLRTGALRFAGARQAAHVPHRFAKCADLAVFLVAHSLCSRSIAGINTAQPPFEAYSFPQ